MSHKSTTDRTFWWRRWAGAGAIAVALAMWPGCALTDDAGSADGATPTLAANLDFTVKDMNGLDVRLAAYRGRPIVLNFWATWCGPCRAEIPALIALTNQYAEQKLAVLGVSVDDSPEDLRRFAAENQMNYPVLVGLGQDKLQETYDAAMFIPITWFIRGDGTVFLKHPGPASREWLDTQVRALVASSQPETR